MKKTKTPTLNLAAIHALGALDGEDAQSFATLLAQDPKAKKEAKAFEAVAERLANSLPARHPSPGLKERILEQAKRAQARKTVEETLKRLAPRSQGGLTFLKDPGSSGWMPLRVPGAYVKVLSFDESTGYAVVLGKLDPGARYPAHTHYHAEDLFMLSGDLHIGEQVLETGDFHHADAGTQHGVNWSEAGCVLLAVVSKETLLAQVVPDA